MSGNIKCPSHYGVREQRDWAFRRIADLEDELAAYKSAEQSPFDEKLIRALRSEIRLTRTKATIVAYLYRSYPSPISAWGLLQKSAFKKNSYTDEKVIAVHVCAIRKKLSIVNVYGDGYKLTPETYTRIKAIDDGLKLSEI